ncbi:MAG TPA: helix-turn-helix domain-containing protein [Candidatus Nanoarchaeia archaeon]|nr:helix-turn-helix domain-containing protein [Candidatus Nanoarchaeia archaeon]
MNVPSEEVLVDLGLSRNEAKAYLALLEIGPSQTGKIAERSQMHRANVYDALERLYTKGLCSKSKKESMNYYTATDPKNLFNFIKAKERQLEDIMPQLQLLRELTFSQSQAAVYEGADAFMNMLHDFLHFKEPILSYGIPQNAPDLLKTKIPHFHKKRIPLKIPMKHIYNHNAQERIAYLNSMPHTEARYLPAKFDSQVSTNICGDEIILAVWISPPLSIRIKDKRIADAYKRYFDVLWNAAVK